MKRASGGNDAIRRLSRNALKVYGSCITGWPRLSSGLGVRCFDLINLAIPISRLSPKSGGIIHAFGEISFIAFYESQKCHRIRVVRIGF